VPLGQPPELVATPTAPTSFSPLGVAPSGARPAVRPQGPSGNTPTNIALTDLELQALMSGSGTTPDPSEQPVEDLQGVPTRVVQSGSDDRTMARYQVPQNATVPLGLLHRPYIADNPYDPAHPNTLSHATGQEVSLKPRLLPRLPKLPPWPVVRELIFKLTGVVPRSSVRLAVTGGVLTLLFALIIILLVSSSGSSPKLPPPDDKTSGAAVPTTDGPNRDVALAGLLTDGGTGPGSPGGKDAKVAHGPAVAHDAAGDEKAGNKSGLGKSVKPVVNKPRGGKSGADGRKR
jgi:hypothetical protein